MYAAILLAQKASPECVVTPKLLFSIKTEKCRVVADVALDVEKRNTWQKHEKAYG